MWSYWSAFYVWGINIMTHWQCNIAHILYDFQLEPLLETDIFSLKLLFAIFYYNILVVWLKHAMIKLYLIPWWCSGLYICTVCAPTDCCPWRVNKGPYLIKEAVLISTNQLWKEHVGNRHVFWCTENKSANISARHIEIKYRNHLNG